MLEVTTARCDPYEGDCVHEPDLATKSVSDFAVNVQCRKCKSWGLSPILSDQPPKWFVFRFVKSALEARP